MVFLLKILINNLSFINFLRIKCQNKFKANMKKVDYNYSSFTTKKGVNNLLLKQNN